MGNKKAALGGFAHAKCLPDFNVRERSVVDPLLSHIRQPAGSSRAETQRGQGPGLIVAGLRRSRSTTIKRGAQRRPLTKRRNPTRFSRHRLKTCFQPICPRGERRKGIKKIVKWNLPLEKTSTCSTPACGAWRGDYCPLVVTRHGRMRTAYRSMITGVCEGQFVDQTHLLSHVPVPHGRHTGLVVCEVEWQFRREVVR